MRIRNPEGKSPVIIIKLKTYYCNYNFMVKCFFFEIISIHSNLRHKTLIGSQTKDDAFSILKNKLNPSQKFQYEQTTLYLN